MNEELVIDLAIRIERIALGWERDAEFYCGRRRQWRLDRAAKLMRRVDQLIMGDLNDFAMRVVQQTVAEAKPRELQPGVFSE